ncbi:hypothetical protein B0T22DRAFT_399089 [Podospora appendiculata]|uniref:BZIP domain-containing protein n=1 Tax=Podospora appendiculata TaxID=314037 RepID=A0AAE1CIL2_9PEZI|nr:hypothetical protein B0T22DRAFT_399089 [Podospora appendiculata]
MDSWTAHTPTPPSLKFENSPTESLLSTPGEMYPSLFGSDSRATSMQPLDIMTPRSCSEEQHDMSALAGLSSIPDTPSTPTSGSNSDKKQTKKRKSWGQVLPEPKTNLPPRKRAKTEDEKEQRRVERVLRNRRAAQSSRERKRQEVEGLEQRNKELMEKLREAEQRNMALWNELQKVQQNNGGVTRTSYSFEGLRTSPTFSHELFSSHDRPSLATQDSSSLEQLLTSMTPNTTVNPASLSPSLTPVPEQDEYDDSDDDDEHYDAPAPAPAAAAVSQPAPTKTVNVSPDATQHPAAMLCEDLQCPSAEAPPSEWIAASQKQLHPALALFLPFLLIFTSTAIMHCQRPLMQIAMSLKAGFSLPPTQPILSTIIWLVTTPRTSSSSRTSTSTTSSTTTSTTSRPTSSSPRSTNPTAAQSQTRPSSTLRLKLLRKILTCSPTLARPLMDATMEALRLVSSKESTVTRVSEGGESVAAATNGEAQRAPLGHGQTEPSKEVLFALYWVIKVHEERKLKVSQQHVSVSSSKLGRSCVSHRTTTPTTTNSNNIVLKVSKRSQGEQRRQSSANRSLTRRRFL